MDVVAASEDLRGLSEAAASGDEDAFEQLVEAVAPTLYGLARGLLANDADAQDAVQETILRTWQKLPTLRDHQAVLGWMCRITRNACSDRMRGAARRKTDPIAPEALDGLVAQLATLAERPDEIAIDRETRRLLWTIIDGLKPKTRAVFIMHIVHDMSAAEISTSMGCAIGTVESQLSRGRQTLIRIFERRGLTASKTGSKAGNK